MASGWPGSKGKRLKGRFNSSGGRLEGLGDVASELGADVAESKGDVRCQSAHSGCRGEGNQSNHQRVLDQVLTIFVFQDLQHHGQLQQFIFHLSLLPLGVFSFQPQKWVNTKVASGWPLGLSK